MRITPTIAIVCGGLMLTLAMGIRQSYGLFLPSMTLDLGIGREAFAFALAIQNIVWGLAQPFAGMLADRFGAARTLLVGGAFYVGGMFLAASANSIFDLNMGAGVLVGLGLAATSFAVVLGAVGRLVPENKRSMALGIASAGGSFGQFVIPPLGQWLIGQLGWSQALSLLGGLAVLMLLLAPMLKGRSEASADVQGADSMMGALREAGKHKSFHFLTLGFFVCGFQVVFVAVHLPAYVQDLGLPAQVGATALALIGFFNIIGTYGCGHLGGLYSKKKLLAGLYVARSVVVLAFLLAPKSELTVLLFAGALGLLWLGTVPLTSGLVGHIYGVRYMSTLFGIVFFSHQVGSFLGAWLGGVVYDAFGSYDPIWWASIVLGLVAALLHLPIREVSLRIKPA